IRTGEDTTAERVRYVRDDPSRNILLTDVIEIGRVDFKSDFAPTILLACVACAKVDCIDPHCAEVGERRSYCGDATARVSNDVSRKRSRMVNDKLWAWLGDDTTPGNLDPVNVSSKAVGPAPPAVLRIGTTWGPNCSRIVTVAGFRLQMRVTHT